MIPKQQTRSTRELSNSSGIELKQKPCNSASILRRWNAITRINRKAISSFKKLVYVIQIFALVGCSPFLALPVISFEDQDTVD